MRSSRGQCSSALLQVALEPGLPLGVILDLLVDSVQHQKPRAHHVRRVVRLGVHVPSVDRVVVLRLKVSHRFGVVSEPHEQDVDAVPSPVPGVDLLLDEL